METSPTHDKSHVVKATRPGLFSIIVVLGFFVLFFVIMSQIEV